MRFVLSSYVSLKVLISRSSSCNRELSDVRLEVLSFCNFAVNFHLRKLLFREILLALALNTMPFDTRSRLPEYIDSVLGVARSTVALGIRISPNRSPER